MHNNIVEIYNKTHLFYEKNLIFENPSPEKTKPIETSLAEVAMPSISSMIEKTRKLSDILQPLLADNKHSDLDRNIRNLLYKFDNAPDTVTPQEIETINGQLTKLIEVQNAQSNYMLLVSLGTREIPTISQKPEQINTPKKEVTTQNTPQNITPEAAEQAENDFKTTNKKLQKIMTDMEDVYKSEHNLVTVNQDFPAYFILKAIESRTKNIQGNDENIYAYFAPTLKQIIDLINQFEAKTSKVDNETKIAQFKLLNKKITDTLITCKNTTQNTYFKNVFKVTDNDLKEQNWATNADYDDLKQKKDWDSKNAGKQFTEEDTMLYLSLEGKDNINKKNENKFLIKYRNLLEQNSCIQDLLTNKRILNQSEYKEIEGKRKNSIKQHEITMTYRDLYVLLKNNEEIAKKNIDKEYGTGTYDEMYSILNDKFEGTTDEFVSYTIPYLVYQSSDGELYISKKPYNFINIIAGTTQTEIVDDDFININDIPGVITTNPNGKMEYVMADEEGSIERHLIISVEGLDNAKQLIEKYATTEFSSYLLLTDALSKLTTVASGVTGAILSTTEVSAAIGTAIENNPLSVIDSSIRNLSTSELIQRLEVRRSELLSEIYEVSRKGGDATTLNLELEYVNKQIDNLRGSTSTTVSPRYSATPEATSAEKLPSDSIGNESDNNPKTSSEISENTQKELVTAIKGAGFSEEESANIAESMLNQAKAEGFMEDDIKELIEKIKAGDLTKEMLSTYLNVKK